MCPWEKNVAISANLAQWGPTLSYLTRCLKSSAKTARAHLLFILSGRLHSAHGWPRS